MAQKLRTCNCSWKGPEFSSQCPYCMAHNLLQLQLQGSDPLFWILQTPTHTTHTPHIHTHSHTQNKYFLSSEDKFRWGNLHKVPLLYFPFSPVKHRKDINLKYCHKKEGREKREGRESLRWEWRRCPSHLHCGGSWFLKPFSTFHCQRDRNQRGFNVEQ